MPYLGWRWPGCGWRRTEWDCCGCGRPEAKAGAGTPSSTGPGVQKTAPTVVLLGDQNLAGVPLVAGGPVHGRELLPGLRRVARGVASQQIQPLVQGGGAGDALVGRAG